MPDRIKSVRIQGFRCVKDVTIELEGLQVLIGENGAGKSTIVEAFEILRRLGGSAPFAREFLAWHGDLRDMVESPERPLSLSLIAEVGELVVNYAVELLANPNGGSPYFSSERAWATGSTFSERRLFDRNHAEIRNEQSIDAKPDRISPEEGALAVLGLAAAPVVRGLTTLLRNIQVMPSFNTWPAWAQSMDGISPDGFGPSMRSPSQLEPVVRLQREGRNLASVFHELLNSRLRERVIDDVRAGLGSHVVTLSTRAASPGRLQLVVSFADRDVPASQLSDGQLTFLSLVALKHLDRPVSVLVVEEPELHLHPALVVRVGWLLEDLAKRTPTIVTTHSDSLLDALSEPVQSIRVVDRDATKGTRLLRLSAERLEAWRVEFANAGAGTLRREQALQDVVVEQ